MLLNDFTEVPSDALRCIASTIFASSFDSGELRLIELLLPTTPPILEQYGMRANYLPGKCEERNNHEI